MHGEDADEWYCEVEELCGLVRLWRGEGEGGKSKQYGTQFNQHSQSQLKS